MGLMESVELGEVILDTAIRFRRRNTMKILNSPAQTHTAVPVPGCLADVVIHDVVMNMCHAGA